VSDHNDLPGGLPLDLGGGPAPDADLARHLRVDVNDLGPEEAVARIIDHGAKLSVSDLFLVANENHVAVQARHLGVNRLLTVLPPELGRRCFAHVKALAGLDVTERRRPLDGRWAHRLPSGHVLDLRISTIPTLYGEDLSFRLLARDSQRLSLEGLGLLRGDLNRLLAMLNNPSGLILVTGPTGSGKTTTLYACLSFLNTGERKINTIEDPIEYALKGVRQSQINPRLDVGFAELLRGVLRQAPDVIMVGEVRDPETAQVAVRAANSGHLVLATLHAPVAAGAVQSMLSLDVHPHFLASALLGAIAQRLVRTLCPACKQPTDMRDAPHTFDEVRRWLSPGQGEVIFGPRGCPACRMLGYTQRTGAFEVLPVSRDIRRLVLDRQTTQAIRQKAIEEGMIEFRQSALIKVAQGETSIEEIVRALPAEYLGSER
jgi:type II secretory ATPase GspE/PulE/Tfp pilus assembly ATPase PilB-like protein